MESWCFGSVDSSLKFSHQRAKAVSEANRTLGMIKRSFTNKDSHSIITLYKSLVRRLRPKLKYCIHMWNPFLKKDIILLEKVQRRATKLITGLKHKSYKERVNITVNNTRNQKKKGNLIEAFKILKKFDHVDSNDWLNCLQQDYEGMIINDSSNLVV